MQKLENRKEALLEALVREYIRTAEPVGSLLLAKNAGLPVSPATIRNELADLERGGFLVQPHTSAGRVPTELAYRYFIEHLAEPRAPQVKVREEVRAGDDHHLRMKKLAKQLAAQADECVFMSVDGELFITGLANLFAKPEFSVQTMALEMGEVLDHLEEMINELTVTESPRALIGSENPLYRDCGVVYSSYGPDMRFGFFGPMRMDYERAIGFLRAIEDIL